MNKPADLSYYSWQAPPQFRTAVLTGSCRSGKTLIGNVLATCEPVEYAEEPWILLNLPLLAGVGSIDRSLAARLFRSAARELLNDMVLLRAANFRRTDESSIWTKLSRKEIERRLDRMTSRRDVNEHIAGRRSLLICNLSETAPYVEEIARAWPEGRIVHCVRNGLDVAWDTVDKRWFDDSRLASPAHPILLRRIRRRGKPLYLPWWLRPGEDAWFLGLTDLERGLYYWCELVGKAQGAFRRLESRGLCITLRYEDLAADPKRAFERVRRFLNVRPTEMTRQALARIRSRATSRRRRSPLDPRLAERARRLYRAYGYPEEELS